MNSDSKIGSKSGLFVHDPIDEKLDKEQNLNRASARFWYPLTEDDDAISSVYSTSGPSDDEYSWIQPSINQPINQQAIIDPTTSSLVDGIYVQTLDNEVAFPTIWESEADIEAQLAIMAADPDIQREIKQIQEEFEVTESDGLTDET